MKIRDVEKAIEESLASLSFLSLPSELEGLRYLPVQDHNPQISIHKYLDLTWKVGRKIREDASANYFNPHSCAVVIKFIPFEKAPLEDPERESAVSDSRPPAVELDFETATDQLIGELRTAERMRPFVGLKWFRDRFLPECGHGWARDPGTSGSLLRRATEQRLILTSQVPNPNQPLRPVTAIRVNRRHPRFQATAPERSAAFKPVPIQGGSISETVLRDRH